MLLKAYLVFGLGSVASIPPHGTIISVYANGNEEFEAWLDYSNVH